MLVGQPEGPGGRRERIMAKCDAMTWGTWACGSVAAAEGFTCLGSLGRGYPCGGATVGVAGRARANGGEHPDMFGGRRHTGDLRARRDASETAPAARCRDAVVPVDGCRRRRTSRPGAEHDDRIRGEVGAGVSLRGVADSRGPTCAMDDRRVLEETYKIMRRLQNQGRNHIWGYGERNLARPVWLSSESQKADVLVGNPPWVAYRRMKGDFQARYRRRRGPRSYGGPGGARRRTTSPRTSSLARRSCTCDGRSAWALVMPYAAMSRRAYQHFRKGVVGRLGSVEFRLRFTGAWTFGAAVQPLFPVPSCVLFAEHHNGATAAALPARVEAFAGTLPRRDADETEANASLKSATKPWPSEGVGRRGIAVPEEVPAGRDFGAAAG